MGTGCFVLVVVVSESLSLQPVHRDMDAIIIRVKSDRIGSYPDLKYAIISKSR